MKKLLMAASFLALLASPALAQSYNPNAGSGNLVPPPGAVYGGPRYPGAQQMPGYAANAMAWHGPDTVIVHGRVVGRDPDPNVRLMLRRDWKYE